MAWPLSLGQAASKKIRKIEKSKNDPSRKANTGECMYNSDNYKIPFALL
jgi:hypothetical protein